MKISGTFFLLLFSLFSSVIASANEVQLSISDLEINSSLEHFKKINLQETKQWQKLIHRERNWMGVKTIQIPDENFLNKRLLDGIEKFENFNELEATFVSFYMDPKQFDKILPAPTEKLKKLSATVVDQSIHPICRFPARLKFLQRNLASEVWNKLPQPNCIFLTIFNEALNPESISFVFSSYYSESPGSAFGHTLFRVNRKKTNIYQKQELLDFGIGYAANVTTSNGALYALLGLFGGFTGKWTNLPYYYKVREYNDYESRDLWSYDLNLTPDELEMFIAHMWEVGDHYYRYYFFTQNCAYHMLTALEAAAPRLNLSEHVPFYYVIPSDSMKALFYEPGLVKNITYRPSLRHVFLKRSELLTSESKNLLQQFSIDKDTEVFKAIKLPQEHALTLDAAIDLVDLKYPIVKTETAEEKETAKIKEALLMQRAQVDYISPEIKISKEEGEDPSQSHGSSRGSLTYFEKNNVKTGFLSYRFALHDFLDSVNGLPRNSQLEILNFNFELKPNDLKLNDITLFKLFNLNPHNFFERDLSWGIELGLQNKPKYCAADEYACYMTGLHFKVGQAFNLGSEQTTGWLMASINGRHGNHILKNKKTYFAPGFEIGVHHRFTNSQAFLATFGREYPLGLDFDQNYEVQYRLSFWQKVAISAMIINDNYGAGLNYYY